MMTTQFMLRCRFNQLLKCLPIVALLLTPVALAQDPYVESLQLKQMTANIKAAPRGDDEPLDDVDVQVSVDPQIFQVFEGESKLEEVVEDDVRTPTLQEDTVSQALGEKLEQFGYDIFGQVPSTFVPVENIPVPPNYLIGPGDTLVVQLYGKQNVEYKLVVTRDGRILVPEYGPINVGGLKFAEAKELISDSYATRFIGAKAVVTMGDLRTVQVTVTGDVNRPGTYTISGLSSLVDALLVTGGVQYSGSLRDIRLKRGGKVITRFDLYQLLLDGDNDRDVALKHGDIIFVPPIERSVAIGGEVQRPAIYELKNESTIADVIKMAGGLLPTASLPDSHIERVLDGRYKTIVDFDDQPLSIIQSTRIRSGDLVRILPLDETLKQVVMLSGHVKRPGGYQFNAGMRVSDLLPEPDLLLPNADLDFAVLVREQRGTKRAEVLYVNLAEIIRDYDMNHDLELTPRDELIILKLDAKRASELKRVVEKLKIQQTDYRPPQTVKLNGHFRYSGEMPLQEGARLLDVLQIGGGIQWGTDLAYAVVAHTNFPSGLVVMEDYRLDAALAGPKSSKNPVILAGDRVYVFDEKMDRSKLMNSDLDALMVQGNYLNNSKLVWANGKAQSPGRYPLVEDMRASDLVCAANGLDLNAFGIHAELSRYAIVGDEKRTVDHIVLDAPELLRICRDQADVAEISSAQLMAKRYQRYGAIDSDNGRWFLTDVIDAIRFDSGKAYIRPDMIPKLQSVLEHIESQGQDFMMHLEGHTDNQRLSPRTQKIFYDNQGLSEARAGTVAKFLAGKLGLPLEKFRSSGFGERRPIASNDSLSGMALNRRVELKIELFNAPDNDGDSDADVPDWALRLPDTNNGADYYDDAKNPLLKPYDQLTFVEKPRWVDRALVELKGEVTRPGMYVIDRGETLCSVLKRAGGTTDDAYLFGSVFTRQSIKKLQQRTLNEIQDKLDDLHVDLMLSHSVDNADKTPAGENKDDYLRVIKQLQRAKVTGRMVVDVERAQKCKKDADVVMKDGDVLDVPVRPDYVHVTGQVYVPTSQMYRKNRTINDYIELSGDETVLGRKRDAYVIQANGEVIALSRWRSSAKALKRRVQPGATIYIPLDVDRINPNEAAQSWSRALLESAILGGVLL